MTLAEFLLARIAEDQAEASEHDRERWEGGWSERHVARVLAECEAKRRIIDDYQREYWPDAGSDDELAGAHNAVSPAWVLRCLALPYADHPDYDESWRLA